MPQSSFTAKHYRCHVWLIKVKKALNCDNKIVHIAMTNRCGIGMTLSKYHILSMSMKVHDISYVWIRNICG